MEAPPQFFDFGEAEGHPGWYRWDLKDKSRFNWQALGPLRVRRDGEQCRLRMDVETRHTNLSDNIHGAATLGLIDIALFAGMHILTEQDAGMAVTLELNTQFIGGGKVDRPIDVVVSVLRETRRLLFLRGEVTRDNDTHLVAAFSGLVRKPSSR